MNPQSSPVCSTPPARPLALGWRALLGLGLLLPACAVANDADTANGNADLVGGTPDLHWSASGYLAAGPSMEALDRSKPACGATLISPNVVVTAAHCVLDDRTTLAFGTGDTGSGPLVRVIERHVHPEFHPEAQGFIDLTHALRMYDVAYLVLERDVDSVEPADLPEEAPSIGCNVQSIGYHASSNGKAVRASSPACVMFRLTLGADPIFEVHPQGNALCIADGDEGSSVIARDASRTKLVGIFVGSVTQKLTDCVNNTQFLNGYESAYGYREFLRAGIEQAKRR